MGPPRRLVVSLVVLVVRVAPALLSCKSYSGTHISAYVDGRIHTVAGKISGTDHQLVKKGDLLVEVDPVDCDVRVERLQKQL